MQQSNPFDQFDAASTPQGAPGVIYGRPKTPDPIAAANLGISQSNQGLAQNRDARDAAMQPLDIEYKRSQIENVSNTNANEALSQASNMRAQYNARPNVQAYESALPAYGTVLKTSPTAAGDLQLITSFAKLADPSTGVREGEAASVSNAQNTYDRLVTEGQRQLGNGGLLSEGFRKQLRDAARTKMAALDQAYISDRVRYKETARLAKIDPISVVGEHVGARFQDAESQAFGRPVPEADYYGNPIPVTGAIPGAPDGGQPKGDIRFGDQTDPSSTAGMPTMSAEQNAAFKAFGAANPNASEDQLNQFLGAIGIHGKLANPAAVMSQLKAGTPLKDAQFDEESYKQGLRDRNAASDKLSGAPSELGTLATQGGSYGLSDEAAGVGSGIGALLTGNNPFTGYTVGRDAERLRIEDARASQGWTGTAAEVAGSLVAPTGAASALGRGVPLATRAIEGAKVGTKLGALSGFGYGEGVNSVPNAFIGAGAGAVVGTVIPALGAGANRLVNSPTRVTGRTMTLAERVLGQETAAAGIAENVPVSRAMVDPSIANKVTGAETTMLGGPIVRRGLAETGNAIEGGVKALGGTGTALERPTLGDKITDATTRWMNRSKVVTTRLYQKAERLAGDARVTPTESVAKIDGLLATLGETPGINEQEIAFLQKMKGDFQNDLSIGGLRRIRTNLRGKIRSGGLTFGEDEARVLGIMDAASNDITNGLRVQKPGAAEAFRIADTAYRGRAEFIKGTVEKIIGKRGADLSAEKIAGNFQAMTGPKGDVAGFGKMMAILAPDEAHDVAATFADGLGKNTKGEFSTAFLVKGVDKLSRPVQEAMFGSAGAESLRNLQTLAREHSRVVGNLNHSRTGASINFQGQLAKWLGLGGGGGAIGLMTGGGTGAAIGTAAGAAVAGAVTGTRDVLTARMAMSPKITSWLANAPRSATPAQVDKYFGKLNLIALRNPALAGDIQTLQQRIMQSANDNTAGRAVASGDNQQDQSPSR